MRRNVPILLVLVALLLPAAAGAAGGEEPRPDDVRSPHDPPGEPASAPRAASTAPTAGRRPPATSSRPWLRGAALADVVGQRLSLVGIGSCTGVICGDHATMELIESLSDLHAGAVIAPELFDRSHSFLMATGYFREVAYELAPGSVGVDVKIHLQGEVFVSNVHIQVAEWFPAVFQTEIRQRLIYRPGTPLNQDEELRARQEETIRRLYERKGFEGTEVRISWEIHEHRAEVEVFIKEGRGYTLRDVYVRGSSYFSADEITQVFAGLLNVSGTSLFGATLIPALTREIREEREAELMRRYGEEGFFEASVRSREERDAEAKVIDLWVDVEEGPRYEVVFTGNEAIPDWELRQRLTFWQSRSVTEQDARRSAVELRRAYQEEGYTFAEVVPYLDPQRPTRIEFRITEGPRAEIDTIHIKGNQAFEANDDVLKDLLASGESGLLKSRRLLPEQLEEDAARLKAFYQDHGYLRIQVLPPLVYFDRPRSLLYRPDQTATASVLPDAVAGVGRQAVRVIQRPPPSDRVSLFLDIPVEEGIQTRIRSLVVNGPRALTRRQVLAYLGLDAGAAFAPARLASGASKLRQHYFESGFPNARVELSCRSEGITDGCSADEVYGPVVDVQVRIEEGHRARLGEVFVRGNQRTLSSIILDELPMEPGDLFDRGKLNEGQARLRSLGLFRAIRISEIGSQPEQPRDRIALVIEVEEKEYRFVDFNLNLRSIGLRQDETTLLWGVEARYRDLDLAGRGLQLGLPFTLGNEKTSLEPSLLWPRPFKLQLPTTWKLFATAQNDLRASVDVLPVEADLGSFFGASSFFDNYNRFRFGTELSVLLENLWGLTTVTPKVGVERQGERKRADQLLCLTGVGTRAECIDFDNLVRLAVPVFFDRRDNPLHPTRGWAVLVEGDYSLKLTLGEAKEARTQYSRLMTTLQGYLSALSSKVVLASMVRFGWVIPLQGPEADIPTDDLFFLGGDGKVRGFVEKSVGRRDRLGVPLGNLVRLMGTAELRFHLAWWLWAATFYDTGLLVHTPEDAALGKLRHSVGLGLRLLLLDLMPLRFDFARVLDRQPEDETSVFTFNLGYTF